MSGTPRHGRNATIMIDSSTSGTLQATAVSAKNAWGFDQTTAFVDVTAFGDTSLNSVAGLPSASGTVSGNWDSADNTIYNLIGSTVERRLYIYPDLTNNATSYIAGKCFFSVKAGGSETTAVSFDLTFQAGPSGAGWVHP